MLWYIHVWVYVFFLREGRDRAHFNILHHSSHYNIIHVKLAYKFTSYLALYVHI
jgi:hypothetical protein